MYWIWFFLCFASAHSTPTDFKKTYQIIFPGGTTFPYAKLYGTIDRPLNDLTFCHWSRTNSKDHSGGHIFSYFSTLTDYSILSYISHNKAVSFRRDHASNTVQINIPETEWLQTCSTWSIAGNSWQIFVNGERIGYGSWSTRNTPIQSNGVVLLGQNQQHTKEGGFDIKGSFIGQISELHLWDYILTPSEIIQVSRCNHSENGNVVDWNQDSWVIYNGARISLVHLPCGQPQ